MTSITDTFPIGNNSVDPHDSFVVLEVYGSSIKDWKGHTSAIDGTITADFINNGLSINSGGIYWIDYGNSSDFNLTGDFTLEVTCISGGWFTGSSYFGGLFITKRNSDYSKGFEFYYYNGQLNFLWGDGASHLISWSFTPSNGVNYYFRLVKSGTNLSLAVNGTQLGTIQTIGTISYTGVDSLKLGGDGYNNSCGSAWSLLGAKITTVALSLLETPASPIFQWF